MPGSARIGSRLSALSWVASGFWSPDQVSGPTSVSGPRVSGLRSPDPGVWARMPRPQSTAFISKDTHCLAFSHFGGSMCLLFQAHHTSALEAVQLSAIPVKRTAAASDELCSFDVWVQARSSATCSNCQVFCKSGSVVSSKSHFFPGAQALRTFELAPRAPRSARALAAFHCHGQEVPCRLLSFDLCHQSVSPLDL